MKIEKARRIGVFPVQEITAKIFPKNFAKTLDKWLA